jgi:hypothetical protein
MIHFHEKIMAQRATCILKLLYYMKRQWFGFLIMTSDNEVSTFENLTFLSTFSWNYPIGNLAVGQTIKLWNSLPQELVDRNFSGFLMGLDRSALL